MDEALPLGSHEYFLMLAILAFGRGMDFLSTWVATPNLVLEGNPIAKRLGWKWGEVFNIAIVLLIARWALPSIVVTTASVLVAARNFQSAWLMHSLGEERYRDWHVRRVQETRVSLFLFCLAGNTVLTAAVGGVITFFSNGLLVPVGIGMGIVAYAVAVAFYTLLSVWRLHRAVKREERRREAAQNALPVESAWNN